MTSQADQDKVPIEENLAKDVERHDKENESLTKNESPRFYPNKDFLEEGVQQFITGGLSGDSFKLIWNGIQLLCYG